MKTRHKSICIFLMILGFACFKNNAIAQTEPSYTVSGIVTDSITQKPADYATVSLKNSAMQIIRTAITKEDGSFKFGKLAAAKYTVSLASMGYVSKSLPFVINVAENTSVDLGRILISPQSNQLAVVSVSADRPVVRQEIDRLVYDLQADPESKGSSVMEMMRKVPLLSVDGEDNILLKGNSSYKIFINGKPSSMMERNAKDILRSMPASSIKNIEVIYNPSSKYDAEGVAGIINIITNKSTFNGYNGSLNLNERFPVGGPGLGGSFSFKQGKFGMSVLGGANLYNSPLTSSFNNRITLGSNSSDLNQNNSKKSDTKSGYFGSDLSYEIDSLNLISAQFNINGSRADGVNTLDSKLTDASGITEYSLTSDNAIHGNGLDAGLNYQLGFKSNRSRLLTFSYHYLGYDNDQFNSIDVFNALRYPEVDYNQTNEGSYAEHTFQIDYVHPVKKMNIEAGLKSILRTNKSNFQYRAFNSVSSQFELNPAQSNKYNNDQDVYAAYNTYTWNLNSWGLRAGVRIEQTIIDADFVSSTTHIKQNYLNLIPAISLSRRFKDRSSLVLSFTKRMQRPGIYQLNPFVDRSNPNFESTGNPNLKPTFTNMAQLSYNRSKKTTISITGAYMFFNSIIGPVSSYDSTTNITRSRFDNVGTGKVLRSNFYINYPATKRLNLTFNTDIRYAWMSVLVNNKVVNNNGFMQYLNVSAGYRLENGWRFNSNFTMNTPVITGPQGKTNAFTASSFGLSKEIVKNRFGFTANTSNPFTKYRRNNDKTVGPDFTQTNVTQNYYRSFSMSLNYRFGKLKEEIKKNQRKIINDDVVNER
jgi:ferric enterobactin receptor